MMAAPQFHTLEIAHVRPLTDDSVAIGFRVPDELNEAYSFLPGQYLTLRGEIGGADTRRSYSICSPVGADTIEVGIRQVPDGIFSNFAPTLKKGDTLQVLEPQGRFTASLGGQHTYLLIAAGSGITPCLSIATSVLEAEPQSSITLIYGNRTSSSIMFRSELDSLKDRYTERLTIVHVLSREEQDVPLFNGRLDQERLSAFVDQGIVKPQVFDAAYICGPEEMITTARSVLSGSGMAEERIYFELFNTGAKRSARVQRTTEASNDGVEVAIVLDGTRKSFSVDAAHETVLEAAQRAGLDLPFSCSGGMCSTCRCKVISGQSAMDVNYSLEDWEVEAGFTLACQTRPKDEALVLDFDAA